MYPLEAIRNQPSLSMGALTKKKKKSNNNNNKKRKRERKWKRERIDRFFSSQWRSRSVTRISLNGMESRETCLARRRFRIILRSVQPNSRVLEMPEIRYSKRFEYLRVSRRVILPPSLRKYSVYDCQGKRERERECESWRASRIIGHFCGHSRILN